MTKLLILLCLIALCPSTFAASFECAAAASPAEKRICGNAALSELDSRLQTAYRDAAAAAAPSSKPALLTEQRHWIRYVRNVCADDACLADAYKARISVLQRNEKYLVNRATCDIPDGSTCRSVVHYRDPAARVDAFNKSLAGHKVGGSIIGCSMLVDLPVGTASGNDSFGGICTLQSGATRSDVKICNDDMIGHFSMQSIDVGNTSEKDLVDFTNAKCFGG